MAFDGHKNFSVSLVAVAPSPATSGTSLTVTSGEGALFPAAPFNVTLAPPSGLPTAANAEIVRVTARTGDVFTLARAQEGSTARAIQVGDLIAATVTAKTVTDLETQAALLAANNVFTGEFQTIRGNYPRLQFDDQIIASGSRVFRVMNQGAQLLVHALNDAGTAIDSTPLTLNRGGDALVGRDLFEKGRTTAVGHWIDVGITDNYYFSVGGPANGNWAVYGVGTVPTFAYTVVGRTLTFSVNLSNTTVYISSTQLNILIPGGFIASRYSSGIAFITCAGMPYEVCFAFVPTGSNWIVMHRNALAAFPAATGVSVFMQMTIAV